MLAGSDLIVLFRSTSRPRHPTTCPAPSASHAWACHLAYRPNPHSQRLREHDTILQRYSNAVLLSIPRSSDYHRHRQVQLSRTLSSAASLQDSHLIARRRLYGTSRPRAMLVVLLHRACTLMPPHIKLHLVVEKVLNRTATGIKPTQHRSSTGTDTLHETSHTLCAMFTTKTIRFTRLQRMHIVPAAESRYRRPAPVPSTAGPSLASGPA